MPSPGSTPDALEARHRLLFELGRGGMGTVYLALARGPAGFHKLKVVKQLRYELAEDMQFLNMFMDEARLSARLNHPNVVQTNEVGFDGKNYFIEMEYLEGQSLDTLLRRAAKRATLTQPMVLWILAQCCAGLHYAHELHDHDGTPLEIVHRDVSPHNVLVTYEGAVKVLDFGIAKAIDSSSETRTGVVKGKATYMAPEQAARGVVDRRADVFAAGVMLWQVVTGKRLYEGLSEGEIFLRLERGDVPPVRSEAPEVSPALEVIIARALAPQPGERYSTAEELQIALEEYLEGETKHVGPRQVAAVMNELFADRREAVRAEVEAKIRGTMSTEVDASVPRLEQAAGVRATTTGPTQADVRMTSEAETSGATPKSARGRTPETTRATGAHTPSAKIRLERTPATGTLVGHSRSPPPLRARFPRIAIALGGGAVALGALVYALGHTSPARPPPVSASCQSATDCVAPGGARMGCRGGVCVAIQGCSTNRECVAAKGKPALCRKDDGVCVALENEHCRVLAEPGDVENDSTVWFGAMFRTTGKDAEVLGRPYERGIDVARLDFARLAHGLPSFKLGGAPRPIAVIACDDSQDAPAVARFLVEEARVPATFGFGTSQELIDLAASEFIPHGMLAMSVQNGSPLITRIPHPPGSPRLVWRDTLGLSPQQAFLAKLVSEVVEPKLRSSGAVSTSQAVRVGLLRDDSLNSITCADLLLRKLRFNGKAAVDNGHDLEEFVLHGGLSDASENAHVLEDLGRFQPHILIFYGNDDYVSTFFAPLERQWPSRAKFRPLYLHDDSLNWPSLVSLLGERPDLRDRFFGMYGPLATGTNLRFTMRYNEGERVKTPYTLTPSPSYDAFYTLAYAAFALEDAAITGANLARGIERLLPPGAPIEVGPGDMFAAFGLLREGKSIDLNGASTKLDFDRNTGDTRGDVVLNCMSRNPRSGVFESGETELVYDSSGDSIRGKMTCHY